MPSPGIMGRTTMPRRQRSPTGAQANFYINDCGDLSEQEQKLVWATQGVPKPDLFDAKAGGTAWKSKPSWYIVGKKDHTVHPDLERAMAKRMGATTYELDSSHVPMLSQPERVTDVIRTASKGLQGATARA